MTLQGSGPISIANIADEFGLAHSTPFPSGFYGLGGAAASGPLSLEDFYGRSNYGIGADDTTLDLIGFSKGGTVHITATGTTIASFTLIAGSSDGHISLGATGGSSTTITASTPGSGNGSFSATYRVTTAHGEHVDIEISGSWGLA